ncbi:MAG TPA: hypothetical protein GXZ71_04720, partial [Clostridiaceae bacterium]|nr:hypothetical protein [Clostridiaceae bacterium]
KKGTAHRVYKSLQSVETWIEKGIENPVAHFQKEVDELNKVKPKEKEKKISDIPPVVHLGYFPLKSIMEKLEIEKNGDYLKLTKNLDFNLYHLISSLTYARVVEPCDANEAFYDILPLLDFSYCFSHEQMLEGLAFLGQNYEKFAKIFTLQTKEKFGIDTSATYFDYDNFYFNMTEERNLGDGTGKKGSLFRYAILTDKNNIPIGLNFLWGDVSKKYLLKDIIQRLNATNIPVKKTVFVIEEEEGSISFDFNCGYLYSPPLPLSEKTEKERILSNKGYSEVKDSYGNLLYRHKSYIDRFPYTVSIKGKEDNVMLEEKRLITYAPYLVEEDKLIIKALAECTDIYSFKEETDEALSFAGYRLFITSDVNMSDRKIYDTYYYFRHIVDTFRSMESDINGYSPTLETEDCIKGYFLICYIALLLERLFCFKVLEDKYSVSELSYFMENFKLVRTETKYLNMARYTAFLDRLSNILKLPLTDYYLTERQVKRIRDYTL